MVLLADLTPEELAYKQATWQKVAGLPGINALSQPKLEALRVQVLSELDDLILVARKAGMSPIELEAQRTAAANQQIAHERDILLNGFALDPASFRIVLGPVLAGFDCVPRMDENTLAGDLAGDILFLVASSDERTSREAQSSLLGICDDRAVATVAKTLRRNYELLMRCTLLAKSEVRAISSSKLCERCRALDGQCLSVSGLFASYAANTVPFPHQLDSEDEVVICSGPTLLAL